MFSFSCEELLFSYSVSIVTGLHDVDEYIQAQLLLAVSTEVCFIHLSLCDVMLTAVCLTGSEHHHPCPETWRDVRGQGESSGTHPINYHSVHSCMKWCMSWSLSDQTALTPSCPVCVTDLQR